MTRDDVVREALSWEGTPYHHRARLRGVGVDCAMLPAAVYEAVGLIPHIEPEYSPQWMLHRDEERFLSWVTRFAREIARVEAGPGDLAIWKFGRCYAHAAIIIDLPDVVHAVRPGNTASPVRSQHGPIRHIQPPSAAPPLSRPAFPDQP